MSRPVPQPPGSARHRLLAGTSWTAAWPGEARRVRTGRKDQMMAWTPPIPAGQPLDATREAAGQVVALAGAQAVAVQAAACLTLAALVWPLVPAARAVAGLASALGPRRPLRPLADQLVAVMPGPGGAG